MTRARSVGGGVPRDAVHAVIAAGAVAVAAWIWLGVGMPAGESRGGLGAYGATLVMWLIMMVAMMVPPVLPWLVMVAAFGERSRWALGAFALGYAVVWAGLSVALGSVQYWFRDALVAGTGALPAAAAGWVLVLAGLYQISPLKGACLRHCRSPVGYFLTRAPAGPRGFAAAGIHHGMFCVGCCWGLMVAALALGAMDLRWMAVVTVTIAAEQLMPRGRALSLAIAATLVAAGGWMLLGAG